MLNGIIAVVFGGVSNENEISVITGTMALNVLKKGGLKAVPVYISQDGAMYSDGRLCDIAAYSSGDFTGYTKCIVANGGLYILNKRGRVKKFLPLQAALNCCHGGLGEGGGLCGLFGYAGIPLAGSGLFASSAFMDKYLTKLVLKALGVPVLPYTVVQSLADIPQAIKEIGFPMVVKPARLGSSIGVSAAADERELSVAVGAALAYDCRAVCEPCLKDKREINVAVYCAGGEINVSECEEAFPSDLLLSFDDKYSGGSRPCFPADLPQDISDSIRGIAADVYKRALMRGIARFDFLLGGGSVYLSEVNTVPGSLSYYLFSKTFSGFLPVLAEVIEQAVDDCAQERRKRVISTGILRGYAQGRTLKS